MPALEEPAHHRSPRDGLHRLVQEMMPALLCLVQALRRGVAAQPKSRDRPVGGLAKFGNCRESGLPVAQMKVRNDEVGARSCAELAPQRSDLTRASPRSRRRSPGCDVSRDLADRARDLVGCGIGLQSQDFEMQGSHSVCCIGPRRCGHRPAEPCNELAPSHLQSSSFKIGALLSSSKISL
jgi:hypothetical protein